MKGKDKSDFPYRPRHWLLLVGIICYNLFHLGDPLLSYVEGHQATFTAEEALASSNTSLFGGTAIILGAGLCIWSAALAFIAYGAQWLVTLISYLMWGRSRAVPGG